MLGGGGFTSPGYPTQHLSLLDFAEAGDNIRFIELPSAEGKIRIDAYPSGANGEIQFNRHPFGQLAKFAADHRLVWNEEHHILEVQGPINSFGSDAAILINGLPVGGLRSIVAGPNIFVEDVYGIPPYWRIRAFPSGLEGDIQFMLPSPGHPPLFGASPRLKWDVLSHTLKVESRIDLIGFDAELLINGFPLQLPRALIAGDNISIIQVFTPVPPIDIISAYASGHDGEIQFNDDHKFGASYRLKWDEFFNSLEVEGNINLLDPFPFAYAYRINGVPFARWNSVHNDIDLVNVRVPAAGQNTWVQYNANGILGASDQFRWTPQINMVNGSSDLYLEVPPSPYNWRPILHLKGNIGMAGTSADCGIIQFEDHVRNRIIGEIRCEVGWTTAQDRIVLWDGMNYWQWWLSLSTGGSSFNTDVSVQNHWLGVNNGNNPGPALGVRGWPRDPAAPSGWLDEHAIAAFYSGNDSSVSGPSLFIGATEIVYPGGPPNIADSWIQSWYWGDVQNIALQPLGGNVGIHLLEAEWRLDVRGDINIHDEHHDDFAYRINGIPFARWDSIHHKVEILNVTGIAAGSNGQIQFNDNGAFGASPTFSIDTSAWFATRLEIGEKPWAGSTYTYIGIGGNPQRGPAYLQESGTGPQNQTILNVVSQLLALQAWDENHAGGPGVPLPALQLSAPWTEITGPLTTIRADDHPGEVTFSIRELDASWNPVELLRYSNLPTRLLEVSGAARVRSSVSPTSGRGIELRYVDAANTGVVGVVDRDPPAHYQQLQIQGDPVIVFGTSRFDVLAPMTNIITSGTGPPWGVLISWNGTQNAAGNGLLLEQEGLGMTGVISARWGADIAPLSLHGDPLYLVLHDEGVIFWGEDDDEPKVRVTEDGELEFAYYGDFEWGWGKISQDSWGWGSLGMKLSNPFDGGWGFVELNNDMVLLTSEDRERAIRFDTFGGSNRIWSLTNWGTTAFPLLIEGSTVGLATPLGVGTVSVSGFLDANGTIRTRGQTIPVSGAGLEMYYGWASGGTGGSIVAYDRDVAPPAWAFRPLHLEGQPLVLNGESTSVDTGGIWIGSRPSWGPPVLPNFNRLDVMIGPPAFMNHADLHISGGVGGFPGSFTWMAQMDFANYYITDPDKTVAGISCYITETDDTSELSIWIKNAGVPQFLMWLNSQGVEVDSDINLLGTGHHYRINGVPIGSPAGANTQIQFNDNGAFGASPNLTFDPDWWGSSTLRLGVGDEGLTMVFTPSLGVGFQCYRLTPPNPSVLMDMTFYAHEYVFNTNNVQVKIPSAPPQHFEINNADLNLTGAAPRYLINGVPFGLQTPWTSDIDADEHKLEDLGDLHFAGHTFQWDYNPQPGQGWTLWTGTREFAATPGYFDETFNISNNWWGVPWPQVSLTVNDIRLRTWVLIGNEPNWMVLSATSITTPGRLDLWSETGCYIGFRMAGTVGTVLTVNGEMHLNGHIGIGGVPGPYPISIFTDTTAMVVLSTHGHFAFMQIDSSPAGFPGMLLVNDLNHQAYVGLGGSNHASPGLRDNLTIEAPHDLIFYTNSLVAGSTHTFEFRHDGHFYIDGTLVH